jgi:hypothetical protein
MSNIIKPHARSTTQARKQMMKSASNATRSAVVKTNWELARRDLLKGLGVGMAMLPLLHGSDVWAQATRPKRLIIVMCTNGWRQPMWKPQVGSLMTQTLPEISAPLEPHKANVMFLPDMSQPAYGGGGHGSYVSCLASGVNDNKGEYRVPFDPTIDQVVGPKLMMDAGLSRIQLPLGLQIEGGNAGIFPSTRMCWKDRNTPITPEEDIYKAYADVYGGKGPVGPGPVGDGSQLKALVAGKKSILDYVGKSLERFKNRLGGDDRAQVESHFGSIRDLEKQLSAPQVDVAACSKLDPGAPMDTKAAGNYPTLMKLSFDLMVAALKCDVTRITTLACADASGSNISFKWVPAANRGWHSMGHTPGNNKQHGDRWLHEQFAGLIDRLKAVPEPGGTMLDNTVILWANHMEEGSNHNSQKTPWMLAGNVGGYFKMGQCVASAGKPVNGVLWQLCSALGNPVKTFGTAAFGGPMDGLTA